MWSEKYNPRVCFDALLSASDGRRRDNLENLDFYSGTRMALPGGGYIDLPGIEPPQEHEETMFSFDSDFKTTDQLGSSSSSCIAFPRGGYNSLKLSVVESPPERNEHMHPPEAFHDNSGMRIKLPGGGFINLPGLESPAGQEKQGFPSDVFQDYGLLEDIETVDDQGHWTSDLFSSMQSLEITLSQKDEIIINIERENKRLREHLGRFIRIITFKDVELDNLQSKASWLIRDLKTRVARLDKRNKSLREEMDRRDATIAALISKAISVPLLRRLLEKGKRERENLQQKVDELEKSNRDLRTKNSILEHELTIIPNEIISQSESKNVIKVEVHSQQTHHVSNEPPSDKDDDEPRVETTVSEQKTCQVSKEDDPEQILVLQSQLIQPPPENKAENLFKKAKKVLSLSKRRRNETSESQTELHTDSLKRMHQRHSQI